MKLVLNRVHILRKIKPRGSLVSGLPCLSPLEGNISIAFLCFCFFLAYFYEGRENRCFKSVVLFLLDWGRRRRPFKVSIFPSRRGHTMIKYGFEVDPFSMKIYRMAEKGTFSQVWPFWLKRVVSGQQAVLVLILPF